MGQSLQAADQIGALPEGQRVVVGTHDQVPAHARREVDDHLVVLFADAVHHFPIVVDGAGPPARSGVADVAMDDGGPRPGRLERRSGDLSWGNGDVFATACRVAGPGHRARDYGVPVHW